MDLNPRPHSPLTDFSTPHDKISLFRTKYVRFHQTLIEWVREVLLPSAWRSGDNPPMRDLLIISNKFSGRYGASGHNRAFVALVL